METLKKWAIAFSLVVPLSGGATPLAQVEKNAFVASYVPGCFSRQLQAPANKYVDRAMLTRYCQCSAQFIADRVSAEGAGYAFQTGDAQYLKPLIEASGPACAK